MGHEPPVRGGALQALAPCAHRRRGGYAHHRPGRLPAADALRRLCGGASLPLHELRVAGSRLGGRPGGVELPRVAGRRLLRRRRRRPLRRGRGQQQHRALLRRGEAGEPVAHGHRVRPDRLGLGPLHRGAVPQPQRQRLGRCLVLLADMDLGRRGAVGRRAVQHARREGLGRLLRYEAAAGVAGDVDRCDGVVHRGHAAPARRHRRQAPVPRAHHHHGGVGRRPLHP
mmetsp:Transcript_73740/g.196244  ORF Transcript_73740/g.196244 Transcript_73740/m.196244 type:complete len:227 (+) Transcript_73740:504-1184(+)